MFYPDNQSSLTYEYPVPSIYNNNKLCQGH
jgi:hypothetical protein